MRLDAFLVQNGYFESRTKAAEALRRGDVLVDGIARKASYEPLENAEIKIVKKFPFVSEGGQKLQTALDDFLLTVCGQVFVDFGASTGGFTHCLLLSGAKRVYAVDVGDSQLHPTLASDDRVIVMDKTNARYLTCTNFNDQIDGAVMDVSFISQKLMYEALSSVVKDGGNVITLVKPQFECGKSALNKNGIVKDVKQHEKVICDLMDAARTYGLFAQNLTTAPIKPKKNIEYLLWFTKGGTQKLNAQSVKDIIYKQGENR